MEVLKEYVVKTVRHTSAKERLRSLNTLFPYWTGTSLQWRLPRGNIIKKRFMSFAFENTTGISLSCKLNLV